MGGGDWIISITPQLLLLGFMIVPIFNAHYVDQLEIFKPFVLKIGIIKLFPYLITALILIFTPSDHSGIILAAVILAPFITGILNGVAGSSWQQIVINTIPPNKFTSLFSLRMMLGSIFGMGAGLIFKFMLERYPGIIGYGYLHLIAFFLLLISYLIFALFVKEPQLHTKKSSHSLSLYQNFKLFPSLFFGNKAFLFLVIQRLLMTARFIIFPWISIYALKILDKPTSFLGELLVWQMAGGFIGNIFSAWIGDRWSSKFVLISGRIAFLLFLCSLFIVKSKTDFYLAFGLFGFSFYTMEASGFAFGLEIIPQDKRGTYLSLLAFIPFPFLILSGLASNLLWSGVNSMKLICIIVAIMTLLSIITLFFIPNPRKQ